MIFIDRVIQLYPGNVKPCVGLIELSKSSGIFLDNNYYTPIFGKVNNFEPRHLCIVPFRCQ
ncbi:MAG TPA: hypothetical protein DEO32_03130 [Ruminococcaceae bacterium]|nr:hypothetical protein [Oscillospiraceae bacterium]